MQSGESLAISPSAKTLTFRYEAGNPAPPVRLRYRLDGVDDHWRDGQGEMTLGVRFLDSAGEQIGQVLFKSTGESPGWRRSLATSVYSARREVVRVPPRAHSFWIVSSSAGPPATFGMYGVRNIGTTLLSASGESISSNRLFNGSDFEAGPDNPPAGWTRDGTRRGMAKVVIAAGAYTEPVLAIEDNDSAAHAEWHTAKDASLPLNGADSVSVEWAEAYSIGISDLVQSTLTGLAPGQYTFRVQQVDMAGNPIADERRYSLIVRSPFWQNSWFWIAVVSVASAAVVGGGRYLEARRMRGQIARFKQEQALDRERLRIAQDIHDDLGARVTHISLISATSGQNVSDLSEARATFDQISQLTRDLVFALYQTVWAVDPENDSLGALVDHLCQITSKQCAAAAIACRLHIDQLRGEARVSSEARHNISMSVSEAVHNAVKHSRASEVALSVRLTDTLLMISVRDNGEGFAPDKVEAGHGLANMRIRMERVGGDVVLEPIDPKGTTVNFSVPLLRLFRVERARA